VPDNQPLSPVPSRPCPAYYYSFPVPTPLFAVLFVLPPSYPWPCLFLRRREQSGLAPPLPLADPLLSRSPTSTNGCRRFLSAPARDCQHHLIFSSHTLVANRHHRCSSATVSRPECKAHPLGIACAPNHSVLRLVCWAIGISVAAAYPILPGSQAKRKRSSKQPVVLHTRSLRPSNKHTHPPRHIVLAT
jgi:hypothetical protein